MKKVFITILCLLFVFIGILLVNTWRFTAQSLNVSPKTVFLPDENERVKRLSQAIQIRTISHENESDNDTAAFLSFEKFLETAFPGIHERLTKTNIHTHSLLYKWEGRNPNLKPVALLAHYDVVPIEPGTYENWEQPPFSGRIADGYVWGRGTLDMKATLLAIMESVEHLVRTGFVPERTIYLALGHDEEIGGPAGAANIAAHLKEQGVELAFTLDEGMFILDKSLSPSGSFLAVIGLGEKGYVTLRLTAKGQGGHSSMPPARTTLAILGRAVATLEENQMPATLSGAVGYMFDAIGPDMPFIKRLLFANQWATGPLLLKVLEKGKTTNAMIRTTTAPTIIRGGVKANVLPTTAHALVNFRILPGDTIQGVMDHVRQVVDDPEIEITIEGRAGVEASPVASHTGPFYQQIQKSILEIFPGTAVAPGLVIAGTDSKHYTGLADNCYRFAPFYLGRRDTSRIHGTNERVPIENYYNAIRFYVRLIRNTPGVQE